ERPLIVEALDPDSPAEHAGLLPGDVIDAIDNRPIATQSDWFAARAHFDRNRAIPIRVVRSGRPLDFTMTIAAANWRALPRGDVLFQMCRPAILAAALLIGFARPQRPAARLLALLVAIVSVGEAFPPSGWAATLSTLPSFISLPIAWASTS